VAKSVVGAPIQLFLRP